MAAERVRGGRRPPRSGTGAPKRQSAALIAAGIAALVLALSPVATPLPAAQAEGAAVVATGSADRVPATTTGSDEPVVALVVAPAASGMARPGEPVSVRVTVTNLGDAPTPALELELDIAGSDAADADRVARWIGAEGLDTDASEATSSDMSRVATATLSPLEPGASAVLDLIVNDASAVLSGSFGARLALVRASAENSPIATDRTALVWVPDPAALPTARTLFVAPIATPGVADGLLSVAQLEQLSSAAGALTRQLNAVAGRAVLVGIDPRVVASIRLLGEQAPPSGITLLERLAAMPNETFLLPWADADLTAVLAAGATELPSPEGAGDASATPPSTEASTTPAPSDAPAPGAGPLTLADAATWPTTFRDVVWVNDALTPAALSPLGDAGTRLLLAPSTALEESATVQDAAGLRLLRIDAALSAAARDASTAPSQQRFDRAVAGLSALLAATAATESGPPAIIALTREELPSSDRLVDTIARTVSLPWSTTTTATEVLAMASAPATVLEQPVDATRLAALRGAFAAEASDRAFARIATTPATLTDRRRLELLAALSVGWGDGATSALQSFIDASVALQRSVRVTESSAITLLADRASLPVTVRNDLDVAVRVFVRVEPDTTQLRVLDPRVEVLVEPRSQTRALVPVESLTNGQVGITVTVQDAEGAQIGDSTRVALNLQAGWETVGTIALGGALVVLLGVGITRDIRKRRRGRAVAA